MKRTPVKRLLIRSGLTAMLLGLLIVGAMDATGKAGNNDGYSALDLYTEVFSKVQDLYVNEVDPKELVYSSINGMLQSLDSHSSFMNPELMKEMRLQITGKYGGLGMQIGKGRLGYIRIEGVFDDTPASRAGLKTKDLITKIDDKDTLDMGVSEAANMMRGKPHTKVTIWVMREGWDKPKEFTLTREEIKLKSIRKVEVLDGQIGHIWIRGFQDGTSRELRASLKEIEKKPGIRGLILDLRDNPGGPLKEAIEVADLFIDKGTIVSIRGRESRVRDNREFPAQSGGTHTGYPVVVLVNGGSASASEIVAGAIQDHGRGVVLGTKTFGKGSVQTILELRDGSGLRLTTALYYTPSGRSIQAKGIEPDIVVEQGEVVKTDNNRRIRESDLPGHFENPEESPDGKPRTVSSENGKADSAQGEDEVDVQLDRAADILRSWAIFQGAKKKTAVR